MDSLKQLDSTLETYFVKKAPTLPDDIQKLIVSYGPYLLALGVLLGVIGLVAALGLTASFMPYVGMMRYGQMYSSMSTIYTIFMGVMLVLQGLALPGLLKKQKQGWTYLFYATLVSTIYNLIQFNIAGLLIGSVLGFYVLYQVKKHYA